MNDCLCMSVPASINERLSSGNVAVQEGRDISITCSVFGIPQPEVTWYRRAGAGRLADSDDEQCQLATTGMERRPSQTNRASPRLCMKKFLFENNAAVTGCNFGYNIAKREQKFPSKCQNSENLLCSVVCPV